MDVSCNSVRDVSQRVSGSIDLTGLISANISSPGRWERTDIFGTPEALEFRTRWPDCVSGTLKLDRIAGGPAVAHATQETGEAGAQSWDGTWVGNNGVWAVELTIADGAFVLNAACHDATPILDTVSGRIDETGRISAYLETGYSWLKTSVTGTPEELDIRTKHNLCTSGPLRLERVGGEPALAHATQETGAAEVQSWDGTWVGSNETWTVELIVADGKFLLNATCDASRPFRETVSGDIDDAGQISTNLPLPSMIVSVIKSIPVSGTPEVLDFVSGSPYCTGGTVELQREGSEPTVALAREPSFNHFDGKWVGKAVSVQGAGCAGTFAIEILVRDRDITGRARPTTRPGWDSTGYNAGGGGQLLGIVDSSGEFESERIAGFKNRYNGTLHADSGKGSGEWFSDQCKGTFELTRVEEPSGSASLP
jgi:hypothetical protein